MLSRKPKQIVAYSGKDIRVGRNLFLPIGKCHEGGYLFKVARDRSGFLGTAYEGSPGHVMHVGQKIDRLGGYRLERVESCRDDADAPKGSSLRFVLTR